MALSLAQYEEIIQRQVEGELTVMIDTSAFRQLLYRCDPTKISRLVGRRVGGRIRAIKVLSVADFLAGLVTAAIAIPAFRIWALPIVPVLGVAWILYKAHASRGRQSLLGVAALVLVALLLVATLPSTWDMWTRAFVLCASVTFFLVRLLYVVTSRFVFSLVHSSYEFFVEFYEQPEGAIFPFLWTDPPFDT